MLLLAFIFVSQSITAQKNISVEDIYKGEFRTEGLQSLASLNNGTEYLVLNYNRDQTQTIDKYSYLTGFSKLSKDAVPMIRCMFWT